MTMKRRDFTTAGCLLLGCAGIPTLAAAAITSPALCTAAPMSRAYFSNMLRCVFQAHQPDSGVPHPGATVELVLQQVESAGCDAQYYLQFHHATTQAMPEGIYQLHTADGTAIRLFLQPSLQQPQLLTAVINQLG